VSDDIAVLEGVRLIKSRFLHLIAELSSLVAKPPAAIFARGELFVPVTAHNWAFCRFQGVNLLCISAH